MNSILCWKVRSLGYDQSKMLFRLHGLRLKPLWVSILEPKVLFSSISFRFWNVLNIVFLTQIGRNLLRSDYWVVCRADFSNVIFSSSQFVAVNTMCSIVRVLLGFVHASNNLLRLFSLSLHIFVSWEILMFVLGAHV